MKLDPSPWASFKIVEMLLWQLGPVDLEEFDENLVRSRNHDVLPETQISHTFLKDNTSGPELANHLFDIVGLDSKMMNTSSNEVFRRLVIEMKPSFANSHEHISGACKFSIENDAAPEKFLVEPYAIINIRSKNMHVMNVTNQNCLLL